LAEGGKLKERLLEFYQDDAEVQNKLKDNTSDVLISAASSRMRTLVDFKNLISITRQE